MTPFYMAACQPHPEKSNPKNQIEFPPNQQREDP
jgi:hypothetical protein